MCTASWWETPGSFRLLFNRDESHTRPPAEPPALRQRGSVRYWSPLDPTGGGTWILVNEFGLTGALLNAYQTRPPETRGPVPSRGGVLPELAEAATLAEAADLLRVRSWSGFRPFLLLLRGPAERGDAAGHDGAPASPAAGPVRLWHWDGAVLQEAPGPGSPGLLSTSSHLPAEVIGHRQALWRKLLSDTAPGGPGAAEQEAFHRRRDPFRPAFGVCLDRADARTVSLSQVEVGPGTVRLRYWARAVDGPGFAPPVECGGPRRRGP